MKIRKTLSKAGRSGCLMPLTIALLAFLLLLSSLYLFPQFKAALGLKNLPTSFDEMRADQVMGYKTVEIRDSLLAQAREATYLVVREQDVSVDVELSQMLWNIPLFEKTKVIHAFGKGAFGLDLSSLRAEDILVDHNLRTVTVTLGEPGLLFVENDYEKTTYEETEHALLSFGEIRLTPEQQTVVSRDIQKAMKEVLQKESMSEAVRESARRAAEELFGPLILAIVPGYGILIR